MTKKHKKKKFYTTPLPGISDARMPGKLIVLEGADGSGRSTQISQLKDCIEEQGFATTHVGLSRSSLVGKELEDAKQGNIMGRRTMALLYSTDFFDQLENRIIPALQTGLIVLADRYIYTLMARDIVRSLEPEWVESLYGMALVPDAVFYLRVSPENLLERSFQKNYELDHWESGMDIGLSLDRVESFIKYQRLIQEEFRRMQERFQFRTINANRSVRAVARELQENVLALLEGTP